MEPVPQQAEFWQPQAMISTELNQGGFTYVSN